MIIVTNYLQDKKENKIYIHSEETSVCPICGSDLKIIGSRNRKVVEAGKKVQIYVIRRLRCKKCGKIHHELPDLLVPYKRHCAQTIEQIISEREHNSDIAGNPINSSVEKSINLHQTTIRKFRNWWRYVLWQFSYISVSFEFKYGIRFSAPEPKEIIRALANAHLWVQTRSEYFVPEVA